MACWADEDDIVCIHPGGLRLIGLAAIRSAFAAMLRHGGLGVRTQRVGCVQTLASAVHSVLEHADVMLPDGLRARGCRRCHNVYHKTPRGWCLVTHHASPGVLWRGPRRQSPRMLHCV